MHKLSPVLNLAAAVCLIVNNIVLNTQYCYFLTVCFNTGILEFHVDLRKFIRNNKNIAQK